MSAKHRGGHLYLFQQFAVDQACSDLEESLNAVCYPVEVTESTIDYVFLKEQFNNLHKPEFHKGADVHDAEMSSNRRWILLLLIPIQDRWIIRTLLTASTVNLDCKEVFEELDSLVDVGGGTGITAKTILEAFTHMKCTVLDLPHVVANMPEIENLKYMGGDMFQSVPSADAFLFKEQIQDVWSKFEVILEKVKAWK